MPKTRHLLMGELKRPYCLSLTPTAIAIVKANADRRGTSISHVVETLIRDTLQPPNSDSETHDENND